MALLATKEKKDFKKELKKFFTIPKGELKMRLMPLTLFFGLVLLDQITKALVVHFMPFIHGAYYSESIPLVGDWISLWHVRNQGAAWSLFSNLVGFPRDCILIILPLLFLILFGIWTLFTKELTKVQRWASASIIAGGIGNLIDRIFRYASSSQDHGNGVVDFIDMSFPKIPIITPTGRWPTFNVADSSIVIGVAILIISMIIIEIKTKKAKDKK